MGRIATRALCALAVVLAAGCAASNVSDTTHRLSYRSMMSVDFGIPGGRRIGAIEVIDARVDPAHLGTRTTEKTGRSAAILTGGDVQRWATDAATDILGQAGVDVVPGDGPTLQLTIRDLDLREVVYVAGEFDGSAVVDGRLLDGGGERWSGSGRGVAQNYGSAGENENYAETINHAMGRALADLFDDVGFRAALGAGS